MDPALPLNALRSFVNAARLRSITGAAAETGVTASAISQQIGLLERYLGKRLFQRSANRIFLTEAGEALYPEAEAHLTALALALADLRDGPARSRLVISATPSLAQFWLFGRIAQARLTGIEIRVEADPVDFRGIDLRIAYGRRIYCGMAEIALHEDDVVAIKAPAFSEATVQPGVLASVRDIAVLPDHRFIHATWGPQHANYPAWQKWFRLAGIERVPDEASGLRVQQNALAISAVRAGLGLALVPSRLIATELAAGQIELAHPQRMAMPYPCQAWCSHSRLRRPSVIALLETLRSEP